MRRDAVTPFRDKLGDLFKEQAKGMDGADVVLLLSSRRAEEIWAVGIDETYSSMKHQDDEAARQRLRHHVADGGVHQAEGNQGGQEAPRSREGLAVRCIERACQSPSAAMLG